MRILEFLNKYLGVKVFTEQSQIIEEPAQTVIVIAGRGFGKTLALICKAIVMSYFNQNHTCLLISASFRQSTEQLGQQIRELLSQSKLGASIRILSENKITFSNGSVIYILPPNPSTIRGFHAKFKRQRQFGITVLIDEACFSPQGDELRKAVEYCGLDAPKGKKQLIICSTPTTFDSWVYSLYERGLSGDDSIKSYHFPSWLSPYVDKDDLERAKRHKSDLEYKQEIGAEFTEAINVFFGGLVDKSIISENLGIVPESDWSYCAGVDLKRTYTAGTDKSALVVCGKLCREHEPPIYKVIDLRIWGQHTTTELGDTLKIFQEKYALEDVIIEHREATALIEYCQANNLNHSLIDPTTIQRDVFSYLHYLLSNHLLLIPKNATELINQLKVFKVEMDEVGNVHFGAGSKRFHDDLVFALGYAIGIPNKENRKGFGLARIISTGQTNFVEVIKDIEKSPERVSFRELGFDDDREYLSPPSEGWDRFGGW